MLIQLLQFVYQLAVLSWLICLRFTSKILLIHVPATSNVTSLRPKLFPVKYILYSLYFLVISLADAPLHLTFSMQHTSTLSQQLLQQLLTVPTFKSPNLNFCSVRVVLVCWMMICRCSGLTSALPSLAPSPMTPAPFVQLWFSVLQFYSQFYSSITFLTPTSLGDYKFSIFIDIISRWLPTTAIECFTCLWEQDYSLSELKLGFHA